jgi:serine/threonine protein kinase
VAGSTSVGSTLGRFRVGRLLGKGGMGEVYAAFDEMLERDVALKVLSEDGDAARQKKRLLREARLAAKLTHPNIATVYEVDELDGRLYIVMELLEGVALRKILLERRMKVDEAVSIARDIARALARAHASGVGTSRSRCESSSSAFRRARGDRRAVFEEGARGALRGRPRAQRCARNLRAKLG